MRYLPALSLSLLLAIAPALAQNGSPAIPGGAPLNSPAFTGTPTAPTATAGTNTTQLATTAYTTTAVANAIAGVNPAVAVQAATTQASDTSGLTYLNGAAGIGATFTGSVNTAFAVDGFTFTALNQRVLIKNDTQSPSGAFNGIYYVTQLQTGILPPVLTRALDYDAPSDINNTGAIPVVNGTLNGTTSWLLTSAVATVGTDPLTYTKFSVNPATLAPIATSGSANDLSSGNLPQARVPTGGTNTQFLQTNGSGTGSWASLRQALVASANSSTGGNLTQYCWSGCNAVQNGTNGPLAPFSGTLKNLYFSVVVAPGAGNTDTLTVYVGTFGSLTATGITCTISNTATACNDTTHTAAITAGQAFSVQIVTSATATATGGAAMALELDNP
jgi:hypothetical protein